MKKRRERPQHTRCTAKQVIFRRAREALLGTQPVRDDRVLFDEVLSQQQIDEIRAFMQLDAQAHGCHAARPIL